MRAQGCLAAVLAASSMALAQPKQPLVTMERHEGPSIRTELSASIILNSGSTLKREWFVIRDSASPVQVEGPTGVRVSYRSGERYSSGHYEYGATFKVKASEPIVAYEIRFVVLDVFGRVLKTLSSTEIDDFADAKEYSARWRIFSENEASEAFASVSYVAQVRTAAGRVYEANRTAIFDHVRKVSRRITEADLEPKRDAPTSSR